MTDKEENEQPIPFLVYDSNTKSNLFFIYNLYFNYFFQK